MQKNDLQQYFVINMLVSLLGSGLRANMKEQKKKQVTQRERETFNGVNQYSIHQRINQLNWTWLKQAEIYDFMEEL